MFRRIWTRWGHHLAAIFTHSTRKRGQKAVSGRWRAAQKWVQGTARRTHREHPIKLLVLNGWRAARVGIFSRSRENLRRTTQRAICREQGTMNSEAEDGAERHPAPAQLGAAPSRSPVRPFCRPPTHPATPQHRARRHVPATSPAAASQTRVETTRSCCGARCCAHLPVPQRCACYQRPCRRIDTSTGPASRSEGLPSPPQPGAGRRSLIISCSCAVNCAGPSDPSQSASQLRRY